MKVAEYIPLVWLKFKGKGQDKAPTSGPKFQNILDITNTKLRDKWATDPSQNWQTLFRIDTASISTSIDLEDDVAKPVEGVTLVKDGQEKEVALVHPKERKKYELCVYQTGKLPIVLNFHGEIPEQFTGGTVEIPVNTLPDELTAGTDDIICDNMAWLIAEVAAELSFKKPSFGNLVNEANDEYDKMCDMNTSSFGSGTFIDNGYSGWI